MYKFNFMGGGTFMPRCSAAGCAAATFDSGAFGAQSVGTNQDISTDGNGDNTPKSETGLLEKIANIGNKALISDEALKELSDTCFQKLSAYGEKNRTKS